MDHFRDQRLRQALREHLAAHGAKKWKLVMDQFPDVPRATFWRRLKAVQEEGKALAKNHKSERDQPAVGSSVLFPSDCLPLRKLAEYQRLIGSAQELINQAKGPGGKINNYSMFAKGVALQESLMRKQVEVMAQLADLDTQNCVFQAILDLVDDMAPELQKQFVARFRELTELSPDALRAATQELRAQPAKRQKGG